MRAFKSDNFFNPTLRAVFERKLAFFSISRSIQKTRHTIKMNRFHRTISTCALKQLALVTPRSTSRCVSSFKIIRTNGIYNLGKLNSNGYIALTRQFGVGATASGKVEPFLDPKHVTERIIEVVKNFDKVKKEKVTATARFKEDLDLDSLDSVEVVMAIEEEFAIEIPDSEADKIFSVQDAVTYISGHPMAK